MELILSSAGSYPRIGETPEAQRHRRAYAQHERGEISGAEWRAVEDEVAEQVVREQTATGLDIVTDGQVRWYDPISHLARHCEGIQINGLLRYFDTNFYFRQPVVSGRIRRREPVLRREFEVARAATDRVVKPVLTGPVQPGLRLHPGGRLPRPARAGASLRGGPRPRGRRPRSRRRRPDPGGRALSPPAPRGGRPRPRGDRDARGGCAATPTWRSTPSSGTRCRSGTRSWRCPWTWSGSTSPTVPSWRSGSPRPARRGRLVLGVIDGRNTKLETRDAVFRILDRVLPGAPGAGGSRPVLRARAPAQSPGAGEAREHGRDRP